MYRPEMKRKRSGAPVLSRKEIDVIGQEIDSISLGNQNELIEMLLEKLTTWFQEHIEALDRKIT